MKYLDDLTYWVMEREAIRVNKDLKLPPPWTDDPIMAGNRWCNVHREDDKVTKWIFEHFMPMDLTDPSIPFALCVARLVNWPETLSDLGYPSEGWTPEYRQHFLDTFAARRAAGKKSWTGAYMVTGGFSAGGETKEVIISRVLGGAAKSCDLFVTLNGMARCRLEEAATALTTPGMGTFLIGQVIADLKNTFWLGGADDFQTWCAVGPGSTMGLNFIHDRPRTKTLGHDQFHKEVNNIRWHIQKETGVTLCAQNTQNCLCELSKYIRAKYFNERLKNTYSAA